MQSESDESESPRQPAPGSESDVIHPVRAIAELVAAADFPRCALGEFVDIGGYTGVVTEVVNQSLKVRSPEGRTKSFNVGGLRRIYGPAVRPEPYPEVAPVPAARPRETPEPPPPSPAKAEAQVEPDFSKPIRSIGEFVKRPDYPECVLGEHVAIAGYAGVVVQIVNRSLKVRSQGETTRSYNADALRRLHTS
jgi:hypothetical protein